jgi:hypothetical protein
MHTLIQLLRDDPVTVIVLSFVLIALLVMVPSILIAALAGIAERFPNLFVSLVAVGSVWLLGVLGAPTYVIVLAFAAAFAVWGLYREVFLAREEAKKAREEAAKCRRIVCEAVVRATYSVHRLLLMGEERLCTNDDTDIEPDPFQTMRVLRRFIDLADQKGIHEAQGFLTRIDLAQLGVWEKGPLEMQRELARVLTNEFAQDCAALTREEDGEAGSSPGGSQSASATGSASPASPSVH